MPLSTDQVRHVARLARLHLSDDEVARFARELTVILDYIDELQQVPTEGGEPAEQFITARNVFREDIVKASLPKQAVLSLAPASDDNYFHVPRVLG
ncbi:Asp-tRNA(Asn)/Glu-tRNA(Gln) amidotransferase subunit GatC [candidate division GN15 bacterium]|nr:Asp-tRNA(Asn)/Glu-tRNA(Gln) amidotransferase subunit GatC [candidate division GN15 bacterium]